MKVKYIDKIEEVGGFNIPRYKYENAEDKFIRLYLGTMYALTGATSCERDLLDFIIEKMDDDNRISHTAMMRHEFRQHLQKCSYNSSVVEYADPTIKKAFQKLCERGLLIKFERSRYIVNPKYFFKKTELERINAIKMIMEFKKNINHATIDTEISLSD